MSGSQTGSKIANRLVLLMAVGFLVAIAAIAGIRLTGVWRLAEVRATVKAEGINLDPKSYNIVPPEPDSNAALVYLLAFQWVETRMPGNPAGIDPATLTHQPASVWSRRETEAARAMARAYQEPIAMLHQAARLRVSAFPVDCAAEGRIKMADLSGAGPLFRVAILEAKLQLKEDNRAAARANLVACGRLLERLGQERPLEYKLMALSLFQDYFGALQDLAEGGQVTANEMGEIMPILNRLSAIRMEDSLAVDFARWSAKLEQRPGLAAVLRWPVDPWQTSTALERRKELMELAAVPYRTTHHRLIGLRSTELPFWCPDARDRLGTAESRMRAFKQHESGVDMCRLGLAVSAWHNRRLRWPANLEALTPEFLPQLPIDAVTGKAFRYEVEKDLVVISSQGLEEDSKEDDLGFVIARRGSDPDV